MSGWGRPLWEREGIKDALESVGGELARIYSAPSDDASSGDPEPAAPVVHEAPAVSGPVVPTPDEPELPEASEPDDADGAGPAAPPMTVESTFAPGALDDALEHHDAPRDADTSAPGPDIEPAGQIERPYIVVDAPAVAVGPAWFRTEDPQSRLGQWASTRPDGTWWSGGLWTDYFPPRTGQPVPAGARTMGTARPAQVATTWSSLRGQRVGDFAWLIALDSAGSVVSQWVTNLPEVAAFLDVLVKPGYAWPGDEEWYLDRTPQAPTEPDDANLDDTAEQDLVHAGVGAPDEEIVYVDEW